MLGARIRQVHQGSGGTYGAPRTTAELREEGGKVVNDKQVARIMRSVGLQGGHLRRRHRTTVEDQASPKAPDLIGLELTAAAVNTKCVGDITCLPVSGGKPLCLGTLIDLASPDVFKIRVKAPPPLGPEHGCAVMAGPASPLPPGQVSKYVVHSGRRL
ncbi:IS3 family transposase [Streptomyces sp. NPDC060030]|uniref:IS3 family transposase n=1 Tax=Streptomyces sp. NPDC060030 TaxID=3347042 RepID=UPI0036CDEF29